MLLKVKTLSKMENISIDDLKLMYNVTRLKIVEVKIQSEEGVVETLRKTLNLIRKEILKRNELNLIY